MCQYSGISGKEPLPNLMDDVSKASTTTGMQDKNRTIKDGIAQGVPLRIWPLNPTAKSRIFGRICDLSEKRRCTR